MPFIMIFDSVGVISDAIRGLLMLFDWVVYELLSILMQVIFDIANFPLNMMALAEKIATRIYLLLAIFMLFKIMISLLGYLVNPDSITDKQQGAGKLISRVIVSLLMLILLPTFFGRLISLQSAVLDSLPRIVLGTEKGYSQNDVSKMGENISWSIFKSFFYYNTSCSDNQDGEMIKDEMKSTTLTEEEKAKKSKMGFALSTINDKCPTNKSYYLYSYKPLISTIAGGFACYVLIGIAITVAIRMFKLVILRIIAPIPLISYMDPKLSKDGPFNKWLKALFSTWLELFINLGILYLVIYLANELLSTEGNLGLLSYVYDLGFFRGSVVLIFIILGLLMFAKQAPKFLLDTLGIKSENGNFGKILNGSLLTAGLGSVGAGITSARASYASDETNDKGHGALNIAKNVGAGLFGGIGGLATGVGVATSKDGNSRKVREALAKRNADVMSSGRSGGTFFGGIGAGISSTFTGQTEYDRLEAKWKKDEEEIKGLEDKLKVYQDETKALNEEKKYRDALISRASSKATESFDTNGRFKNKAGDTLLTGNYRTYHSVYEAAQSGVGVYKKYVDAQGTEIDQATYDNYIAQGASSSDYTEVGSFFKFNDDKNGITYEVNMADASSYDKGLLDANKDDYYEQAYKRTIKDDKFTSDVNSLVDLGVTVDQTLGAAKVSIGAVENSINEQNRRNNAHASDISKRKQTLNSDKQSHGAQRAKANRQRGVGKP